MLHRIAISLFALYASAVCAENPPAIQDMNVVRAAAEQFIKTQPLNKGISVAVEAGVLDPRLHLPHCTEIEAFMPAGGRAFGNTTVGVRCGGGNAWTIYIPVRVNAFADVVIANRPIARGATLSAADVRLERRDLATLPYGYVLQTDQITGKSLVRGITEGTVLNPNILTAPKWVKRGERVTVLAQAGGMEIRMNGEALMDGTEGSVIRVRNLNSARVVEGTVIAQGVIQVRL
jgi:flagella basal body P-ring formation protein FlgA